MFFSDQTTKFGLLRWSVILYFLDLLVLVIFLLLMLVLLALATFVL